MVSVSSCNKEDDPESQPIINWLDLAHFDAKVTKTIVFGQTPEGVRGDIYFEGSITGDSINGYMSGIDYYLARENEPDKINAHAVIVTDDDALITSHIKIRSQSGNY